MRSLSALALVSVLTAQAASAEEVCTLEHAVYSDGELGYQLKFRPPESWEQMGMVSGVFEMTLPDQRVLWGQVASNMGTSRDVGSLYFDCDRPGPDDAPMSEQQDEECKVWSNVVYAIADGRIAFLPMADEPAPPSLVLADLGRKLRYSVLDGPGDEPWDQFDLTGCE